MRLVDKRSKTIYAYIPVYYNIRIIILFVMYARANYAYCKPNCIYMTYTDFSAIGI